MALQLGEVLNLPVVAAIDMRVLGQDERFSLFIFESVPVGLALEPTSSNWDPTECPDLTMCSPVCHKHCTASALMFKKL